MIYAVQNEDGEVHIVGSLDGYEAWTKIDETDQPVAHPVGVVDGKLVSLQYMDQRRSEYPPLAEQLDMIYHDPEAWRSMIGDIKSRYPKPV